MADSTVLYFEDQEGNEIGFELIGSFQFEGHRYVVLFRLDSPDPSQVTLVSMTEGPNGEANFQPIEDDALYERVAAECDRIFNEEMDVPPQPQPTEEEEDFCYQDEEGRLFLLGENNERIYLNEYGEPIEE
ncbi:MAG: DUF1292 domain-containing protein [Eubacteriales bacterium]